MIDPSKYMDLVKGIAGKLKRKAPRNVDYEDLVGHGMVGLMEAASRFDDSLGYKFSTFAFPRIRGAMLDYIKGVMDDNAMSVHADVDVAAEEPEDLSEEMAALEKVMKTIPKRERELLLTERGNQGRTHRAYGISRSWSSRIRANATRLIAARVKGNIS